MTEEQAAVIRAIADRYASWEAVPPPPPETPPLYVRAEEPDGEKCLLAIEADGTTRAQDPQGGSFAPLRLYGGLRKDGTAPPGWGRGLPKHARPWLAP